MTAKNGDYEDGVDDDEEVDDNLKFYAECKLD